MYKSHETCDSLYIVLFAEESSSINRSEILGVFISSYHMISKKFYMNFVSLVKVSSTAFEIIMEGVVNTLKARHIDIKKFDFLVLVK